MSKFVTGKMTKAGKNFTGVYFRVDSTGEKTFYIVFRRDGKLVWERVGSETQGVTALAAHRMRKDKLVEMGPAVTIPTLDSAIEKHILAVSVKSSAAYTTKELARYSKWIKPTLGGKKLNEITVEDLNLLRAVMAKAGKSVGYAKLVVGLISRVFNFMSKSNVYRGFNPGSAMEWKGADAKRKRHLMVEESVRLLAELKKRSTDMFRRASFAIFAGLRRNEIQSLTPADIDLDAYMIRIRNVKDPTVEGKVREVFFPQQLADVIKEIYSERKLGNNDPLFPKAFQYSAWIKAVDGLNLNQDRTSLDRITFHGLRHTYATLLGDLSNDPYSVKSQLGHGQIEMSMRYTHVDQRKAVPWVQLLGQTFSQCGADLTPSRPDLKVVQGGLR